MYVFRIVIFYFLCFFQHSFSHVLIFTYAYNRPEFIEIQHQTFKKFLKDEYEFIVFNDANNENMCKQIEEVCAAYAIKCVRIPQEIHNRPYLQRWPGENYNAASVRNSNVVMYSLNEYGFKHDDIIALFDSDMFIIKDFSIREYLKNYELSGWKNGLEYPYLWIGLVFMDFATMPNKETINFNCGRIHNTPVDAGGSTYHYLINNPIVRVRYFEKGFMEYFGFDENKIKNPDDVKKLIREQALHDDTVFLHYWGGTNWMNWSKSFIEKKNKIFDEYIKSILTKN